MAPDQEASKGHFLDFLRRGYVVCSHKNRLIEAILMSTHNIPFSI